MLAEYDFQTKQEAQDAAFNLLTKENDSHGLPENWQKDFILLSYWETIKGKQKLKTFSAEEAIVSKYLSNEYSTLLSPFSLRDISEGTGIPMSIIYKATKLRKWD